MSWLFSLGMVEDCLHTSSLDGKQSALSSWIGTADAFSLGDRMNDTCQINSRYGMTFVPLTAERGAEELMSYLEDFHAKPTQPPPQEKISQTIFGAKCEESWQMSLPGTSLQRTLLPKRSMRHVTTSKRWVMKPEQLPLARQTWAQTTFGNDLGYLHTPTTKANYCADSMQKWPCSRNFKTVFGKATPENHEYLMGWPIGWSDLKELETDKFRLWLQQHSCFLQLENN